MIRRIIAAFSAAPCKKTGRVATPQPVAVQPRIQDAWDKCDGCRKPMQPGEPCSGFPDVICVGCYERGYR